MAFHDGCDGLLIFIRQLEAVRAKKLDAIIFMGIMAGGNHDAEISTESSREIRHTRGRQWPQQP